MGQKANTNLFIDITRTDETERMVYGYATTEALDAHGTVIDLGSVQKCLPDYLVWRNIREMHQPSAVGTADEVTLDDKGLYIGAHIVDDQAWEKVIQRVYKGFSIGGKKDYQIGNRIFIKKINEITLGDRPSNEECTFDTFRVYQEEENMEEETTDVKRYAGEEIGDVATALNALETISWLINWEEAEALINAHPEAGEQLASLKAAAENLKKFIASEIKEDTSNATTASQEIPLLDLATETERIEGAGDVTRSGARHSANDLERIQAIHEAVADLGATCRVEECARIHGFVNKVVLIGDEGAEVIQRLMTTMKELGLEVSVERTEPIAEPEVDIFRIDGLDRDITGLDGAKQTITELVTRLAVFEAEPEPAKGVKTAVTVTKEQDTNLGGEVTRTAENDLEPATDPKEAIQRIHKSGGIQIKR